MKYKIKYINLAEQYKSLSSDIKNEFKKIFKNSSFILRKHVTNFEKIISKKINVKYTVGVNSGTDALLFALAQIGITKNDEIITPSHTYVATISAIVHVGAKPVFVDIQDDFNINPDLIEKKITSKTKAILPVHLNGRCCNMRKIKKIAKKYNLKIIEDAAQAFGSKFNKKFAGSFGHSAAFSLHPMKNLNVPGDGGFLTTNQKKIYNHTLLLRDHGRYRNKNLKEIRADYCGGDIHSLKYLSNKYAGKKVIFVPYEQAEYIIMINTVSNDINNKSRCFSLRPGEDIISVDRLGVKLSVLRKLKK